MPDNPPAFPYASGVQSGHDQGKHHDEHGMSLRDYFAGQALIALLREHPPKTAAMFAYDAADSMLRARETET